MAHLDAGNLDPKRIVADGYDFIGDDYAKQAVDWRTREREWYVSALVERLQAGSRVLDLGCGAGVPTTRRLAEHFDVTGVDRFLWIIARKPT